MEREEILFRTLERYLIADRLSHGFSSDASDGVDIDGFLSFSLSVQNRRKSRVGFALENHLEQIFTDRGITYTRAGITEKRKNVSNRISSFLELVIITIPSFQKAA
jgi:hypothetical protein